ncbi:MAG: hypothetical protein ACLFVE_08845 [Chitinispirillaceae bacterium]
MEQPQKLRTYPLPLEITLTFPPLLVVLFVLMGPFFLFMLFIIPFNELDGSALFRILMFYIFCPLMGIAFVTIPFYQNVAKKSRIVIDEHGIKVRSLSGRKIVAWDEVVEIKTYTLNYNKMPGFVTRDKVEKLKKSGLGASLNASYGGCTEYPFRSSRSGSWMRKS